MYFVWLIVIAANVLGASVVLRLSSLLIYTIHYDEAAISPCKLCFLYDFRTFPFSLRYCDRSLFLSVVCRSLRHHVHFNIFILTKRYRN